MRRKKSKYKSLLIGNKKYYFYSIHWDDILGDSGHASEEEFEKMKCAKMLTHAFVFKKNKKYLWTFSSYDTEQASFSDRNIIPIACVTKMIKVML